MVSPLVPVPSVAGAPVLAHDGHVDLPTRYFGLRSVRDTWVALWVLWLLWSILFLVKQSFGAAQMMEARRSARVTAVNGRQDGSVAAPGVTDGAFDSTLPVPTSDGTGGTASDSSNTVPSVTITHPTARPRQGVFGRAMTNIRERIDRAYDLVRDLTLMLLLVVTLNTFGLGSEMAMLILVWVYLFVALIWASVMMLVENCIVDLVFGAIEMLLLLAMLVAAYTIGWTVIN